MRKIKIDPKIVDPADTQMLEDLVLAATRDARTKVGGRDGPREMQKVTGGICSFHPSMKLPFLGGAQRVSGFFTFLTIASLLT